jgi:hypothetical protein
MKDDVGSYEDQGSVYLFVRLDGVEGDGVWSEQQKLSAGDGRANDYFGVSVALDGDTALVGAYWDDAGANWDQGSAYVYVRMNDVWSLQQKLTAGDGAAGDEFGWSLALEGDVAVVGAAMADVGGDLSQGAAYVLVRGAAGWSWEQKLLAANGAPGVGGSYDRFGGAVALAEETALVGAETAEVAGDANRGRAHFFARQDGMFGSYLPLLVK